MPSTSKPRNVEVVKIEQSQAAASGQRYVQRIDSNGIMEITHIHFPPNCNALVDVAVGIYPESGKSIQLIPTEESTFINLDDVTIPFHPYEPVESGYRMWVDIYNYDAVNPHNISVIAEVRISAEEEG